MADIQNIPLISADSHVIEDPDLWANGLPSKFRSSAPTFERKIGAKFQAFDGGWNPRSRVSEMAMDGVVQDILYPSFALELFGLTDPVLQQACFSVYNDWLIDYCSAAPDRLFGVATLSTYDIGWAVAELQRCRDSGLRGAMVWMVPPPELAFTTAHYDPLWELAESLQVPISVHILTGVPYPYPPTPLVPPRADGNTLVSAGRHANNLVFHGSNVLSDLITTGVFERFPRLHFVLVECEASWLPFILSSWDKYSTRTWAKAPLTMKPSEYFTRNCHATFFNDPTIGTILKAWGADVLMWSNDYPHPNTTWPESRRIIDRDLQGLAPDVQHRLLAGNTVELYRLPSLVHA